MRAVVYDAVGQLPTVREVPDPVCEPDGVVLDVGASGVCRSDWHAWKGHDPVPLPAVGGHEYAGVVREIGPLVTGFAVGDRVTAPFVCGCGRCAFCAAGEQQVCPQQRQPGFTEPGSFAERVAVPAADTNLVSVPPGMELTTAAGLGCRFATAYRAVRAHGGIGPGSSEATVAVFGCGGVGLSAVMIAAAVGAGVVAVDTSAAARDRAEQLGAVAAIDPADGDIPAAIRALGAPFDDGVDVGIDALGSADLVAASVHSLRRRGRHVQVGLLFGAAATPPLPMDRAIAWELSIRGSHGMAAHAYPAMLAEVADGLLHPDDLVGEIIGLNGVGAALAAMDHPRPGSGLTVMRIPLAD